MKLEVFADDGNVGAWLKRDRWLCSEAGIIASRNYRVTGADCCHLRGERSTLTARRARRAVAHLSIKIPAPCPDCAVGLSCECVLIARLDLNDIRNRSLS